MPRAVNRTPRHLDDPLKLGPLTLAQWVVAILATVFVWVVPHAVGQFSGPLPRVDVPAAYYCDPRGHHLGGALTIMLISKCLPRARAS